MNYKEIMQRMVNENLSIREMANELGISKSTLHYKLKKIKEKLSDDDIFLSVAFENLMGNNKKEMQKKGANKRWN